MTLRATAALLIAFALGSPCRQIVRIGTCAGVASSDSTSLLDFSTLPPTRDPRSPGYPPAIELPDGQVPSPRQDGNFIIGLTHPAAPEMTPQAGVARGRVVTFTLSSTDSTIFPGQVRDESVYEAPADPADPATLVLTTVHPGPWTRVVDVWVPAGYVAGTPLPFMVDQDGPNPELFTAVENLVAQRRLPPMAVVSTSATAAATPRAASAGSNTTRCRIATSASSRPRCCHAPARPRASRSRATPTGARPRA